MHCDRLSDDPHVPVKPFKLGMDLEIFDTRGRAQKTLKRGLNNHALADAPGRSVTDSSFS
jgi:hypothetical protein